jgi:protein SCO1/2
MKLSWRTGLLLVLLAVPVFLIFFLHKFGQNHFKLVTYFPEDVQEKVVDGKTVSDTIFHAIPPFRFTSSDNEIITEKKTENKIYIADFFFTTCPGICPLMSNQLKRVQEAFIDYPDILILSHTVDPDNDSLSVLRDYAKAYKAIKGKWYFLRGDKDQIYELAQKGYFISALEDEKEEGSDRFVHSDKLVLVDKERHIRGFYNGTDPKEVDRLILETKVLLSEYGDDTK